MRTRRLPTGGLAALAVTLAALAVVVVAGVPPPRTVVRVRTDVRRVTVLVPTTRRSHPAPRRAHRPSTGRLADAHGGAPAALGAPSTPPAATTTTFLTPSTTTTIPPVTTTTAPPTPSSRRGTFEGGRTTATERLGAVRSVTVSVPVGIRVTLSVTCGLATSSATSFSSATVHVHGGGASCVATFRVPPSSPQPSSWRLVTS